MTFHTKAQGNVCQSQGCTVIVKRKKCFVKFGFKIKIKTFLIYKHFIIKYIFRPAIVTI